MFKRRKHCCRNVYIIGNAIFDGLEDDETEDGDVDDAPPIHSLLDNGNLN